MIDLKYTNNSVRSKQKDLIYKRDHINNVKTIMF